MAVKKSCRSSGVMKPSDFANEYAEYKDSVIGGMKECIRLQTVQYGLVLHRKTPAPSNDANSSATFFLVDNESIFEELIRRHGQLIAYSVILEVIENYDFKFLSIDKEQFWFLPSA